MEKPLRNSINMIRTTLSFCTNNPTPTSGIPAFALVKTSAENKLVLIDSLSQIAAGSSKGVTLDTIAIRGAMASIGRKCGNAVGAYAASVNNNTLRISVSFTKTQFNRFAKEEIDDICQTIHDEADTNIAVAGDFGYGATDVTDLQTAIDLYRLSVQNPRQAIISKGQAIKSIKLLVREIIDNLFKLQMDKMVETLPETERAFIDGYKLSRETIDLGSTHAKIRGTVRNKITAPLQGVLLTIRKSSTGELVIQVLSSEDGSFAYSPLLPGNYDFFWSLNGYQTISETNVHVSAGKELKRKITMLLISQALAVREGDLLPSAIANILTEGINATDTTTVTIEVTGATVRFYKAATTTDPPGAVFFDKEPGSVTMLLLDFVILLTLNPDTDLINVQNIGLVNAHYKITFTTTIP